MCVAQVIVTSKKTLIYLPVAAKGVVWYHDAVVEICPLRHVNTRRTERQPLRFRINLVSRYVTLLCYCFPSQELSDELKDWLATLHLRAPQSTVLLCGTHKDKCVPLNIFEKTLQDVEESVNQKHKEWKRDRRKGHTNRDEELELVSGIQLVSSSPTLRYSGSGLLVLQAKLITYGTGTQWWIPPSWSLALVVLDAVRDEIAPVEAARLFVENLPPPQRTGKCTWIAREDLSRHWETVQECSFLPAYLKAEDREFTLESVLDLR